MKPSLIFNSDSELFEGPVFDKKNNLLYFVSILDCLVFCYNPKTKEILSVKLDTPTSCIYFIETKIILVSTKKGFFRVNFNTLQKEFAFQIDIDNAVRYNDGIEDVKGRIIIGTMGYPQVKESVGQVYSYFKGVYKTIINNTTISNGLAFSADNKFLFFIDTPTKKVAKYAYNIQTGDVEFLYYVIEFKGESFPDGMCIDKNGMLWIAEWNGGCISKWNPNNGERLKEIKIPSTNVTSCCFDYEDNLYISAAKDNNGNGGGLFFVELN